MKFADYLRGLCGLIGGVLLVGCGLFPRGQSYIPSQYTLQPIDAAGEGLSIAMEVANNWDESAYLAEVTSVFEIADGDYQLSHSFYIFVSGSRERYIGVVVDASGEVTVSPPPAPAEGSFITTTPYILADNAFEDVQALELGWRLLGKHLETNCEIPRTVSVQGIALDQQSQVWNLNYS